MSWELTYPLKMMVFNRNLLFQWSIFRGYVSLLVLGRVPGPLDYDYIYYFPDGWAIFLLPSDGQARTLWKSPGCTWNQRWKITMEETKNPSKIELVDTQVFFRGPWTMGSVGEISWIKNISHSLA